MPLLLTAIGIKHRGEQAEALPAQLRGAGQFAFVLEDVGLQMAPAGASVLDRPMGRGPASLVEYAVPPAPVIFVRRMHAGAAAANHILGQSVLEKGPHRFAKGQILGESVSCMVISLGKIQFG